MVGVSVVWLISQKEEVDVMQVLAPLEVAFGFSCAPLEVMLVAFGEGVKAEGWEVPQVSQVEVRLEE